jgi:hypothetical protein
MMKKKNIYFFSLCKKKVHLKNFFRYIIHELEHMNIGKSSPEGKSLEKPVRYRIDLSNNLLAFVRETLVEQYRTATTIRKKEKLFFTRAFLYVDYFY